MLAQFRVGSLGSGCVFGRCGPCGHRRGLVAAPCQVDTRLRRCPAGRQRHPDFSQPNDRRSSISSYWSCRTNRGTVSQSNTPSYLATILKSLPRPSREDLVALNASLPSCSVGLLRASNSIQQILTALDVIATVPLPGRSDADLPDLYAPLHALAVQAVQSLEMARKSLDGFCPK